MDYDIFNGDADGICSLHQLRLAQPIDAKLITGVKRDNNLLHKINPQPGDNLTVLDVSLDKNRNELISALENDVSVFYCDHHYVSEIPYSDRLDVHIDTRPDTCTSLIINRLLKGEFAIWAAVGAYGDNLHAVAEQTLIGEAFKSVELEKLKLLGTMLNYNGYGIELDDLHFHPEELYRLLHDYTDPFAFIYEEPAYKKLLNGYQEDLARAIEYQPDEMDESIATTHLPDDPWARRVSGVYSNKLAIENPKRAHALLTKLSDGGYRVSVRSPLVNRTRADSLCRQFKTGGGRSAAAGINQLPEDEYDRFINLFKQTYASD